MTIDEGLENEKKDHLDLIAKLNGQITVLAAKVNLSQTQQDRVLSQNVRFNIILTVHLII